MAATPAEQTSAVRAALGEIVTEHGPEALSNPSAMSNLLTDFLPDSPGPARMLVAAAEDHIADALREHVAQGLDPVTAARLAAASFASATMFSPEACAWVVGELGIALGLLSAGASPPSFAPSSPGPQQGAAPPTAPAGGQWHQPAPGTRSVPFAQPATDQPPQGQSTHGRAAPGRPAPGRAAMSKPRTRGRRRFTYFVVGAACLVAVVVAVASVLTGSPGQNARGANHPGGSQGSPGAGTRHSGGSHSAAGTPAQFKPIALGVLCNSPNITTDFEGCQAGNTTQQVGSHIYTWDAVAPASTTRTTVMAFPHSTCRSLTLTFGFSNTYEDLSTPGQLQLTVSVVQGQAPLKQVTVTNDELGKLTVRLDGGPWGIDTLSNLSGNWGLFMNGSASCSTYNGE